MLALRCVANSSALINPEKRGRSKNPAGTLHARKQQFVHDEIWVTAIGLFAEKGFDETTVEDIAAASGLSRRSFFRYFSSKDDLMAQAVLSYGIALTEAISTFPPEYPPSEVLRSTVLSVAGQAVAHPQTRTIMQIAAKYPAAREAQLSRFGEVQHRVGEAFAQRMKPTRKNDLAPKILAALTLSMIDTALQYWFEHGRQDISAIVDQVFTTLGQICDEKLAQTPAGRHQRVRNID